MRRKTILERALAIPELGETLGNIAHDDGKRVEDYSDSEILDEARYVLSTFLEGGHQNNDELTCDDDREAQRSARRQVKALKQLLGLK